MITQMCSKLLYSVQFVQFLLFNAWEYFLDLSFLKALCNSELSFEFYWIYNEPFNLPVLDL